MELSKSEVGQIAHLARLEVREEDATARARDLGRIVDLFASLAEIDTEGVLPMAHPLDLSQRLRPDEVTEHVRREEYQGLAPEVIDGLYVVPKVIE